MQERPKDHSSMPPETRSAKRKERYRELRTLGFSATEARRLRDTSGDTINTEVTSAQRRISRKPQQLRTSEEVFRLERIRNYKRSKFTRRIRVDSRQARWERFSKWSKAGVFPKELRARIVRINQAAGLGANDGFGYRQFYYEYVERLSREDATQFADRADSGIRYLVNKPLVPGRTNIRTKLRASESKGVA